MGLALSKVSLPTAAFYDDPSVVSEAQKMVDERKSMAGLDVRTLELKMQERGVD
jgi:pyridoxal 5'-phosphate synthase pdxS subunit